MEARLQKCIHTCDQVLVSRWKAFGKWFTSSCSARRHKPENNNWKTSEGSHSFTDDSRSTSICRQKAAAINLMAPFSAASYWLLLISWREKKLSAKVEFLPLSPKLSSWCWKSHFHNQVVQLSLQFCTTTSSLPRPALRTGTDTVQWNEQNQKPKLLEERLLCFQLNTRQTERDCEDGDGRVVAAWCLSERTRLSSVDQDSQREPVCSREIL